MRSWCLGVGDELGEGILVLCRGKLIKAKKTNCLGGFYVLYL
jgi:hypothetical protein